ncbi:hypothetical protein I5G61_gp85 [Mycobacterium phage Quesadilla]|uniref:Uncharacterized protein n=1 Tax=Mycobacterium phage Quesadilla TaxID=2664226 RepID=A0A5Q2WF64_9CAUD|nr:hypothetical protein I5G61_gp85 [Mycobacterium phage Quesadilla]QGH75333.1 hypothetical protein SEA_QUESADILLA_85 [Mycobacterium phage Quesadilla]
MFSHYSARYAAEGGPGVTLPTIPEAMIADETANVMSIVFAGAGRWVLADSQGQVYAEAENPAELGDWLTEYLDTLGQMVERGEL